MNSYQYLEKWYSGHVVSWLTDYMIRSMSRVSRPLIPYYCAFNMSAHKAPDYDSLLPLDRLLCPILLDFNPPLSQETNELIKKLPSLPKIPIKDIITPLFLCLYPRYFLRDIGINNLCKKRIYKLTFNKEKSTLIIIPW